MGWYPDYTSALAMAIISLVMWGSWSVSMKLGKITDNNLSLFLLDYAFGTLFSAIVFAVSLGWTASDSDNSTTLENIEQSKFVSIAYAFIAGFIFNIANTLLVVGINIAGMAVAFPIGIGLSFAVGTILTYVVQPKADPCFMFSGVGFGVLAVVAMGTSYHFKLSAEAKKVSEAEEYPPSDKNEAFLANSDGALSSGSEPTTNAKKRTTMALVACGVGGCLMGLWSPLNAEATGHDPGQLNPYSSFFFFVAAVAVSMPIMSFLVQRFLGSPGKRSFRCGDYCKMSCGQHVWGLLGGVAWAVGTVFNMISGSIVGCVTILFVLFTQSGLRYKAELTTLFRALLFLQICCFV